MEPQLQFHEALLAYLKGPGAFSRPVYDEIPEEASMPYVVPGNVTLQQDDAHGDPDPDVDYSGRGWLGTFVLEVEDLAEHGKTRVLRLLSELDDKLHGKEALIVLDDFKINWIRYQSSASARSDDDQRFTGAVIFEISIEET